MAYARNVNAVASTSHLNSHVACWYEVNLSISRRRPNEGDTMTTCHVKVDGDKGLTNATNYHQTSLKMLTESNNSQEHDSLCYNNIRYVALLWAFSTPCTFWAVEILARRLSI